MRHSGRAISQLVLEIARQTPSDTSALRRNHGRLHHWHGPLLLLLLHRRSLLLLLWLWLMVSGLWQMERIYRRWKGATDETEAWISPLAAAL